MSSGASAYVEVIVGPEDDLAQDSEIGHNHLLIQSDTAMTVPEKNHLCRATLMIAVVRGHELRKWHLGKALSVSRHFDLARKAPVGLEGDRSA